jgi:hypothetical protein
VRSCFHQELFFTALQAQINIAIRINAAIFVEIFFKGNKIFNSKHYFMVKKIKLITSLQQKKYRTINKLFCRRKK